MAYPAKTAASYSIAGQKAAAKVRKEKKEVGLTDKQRDLITAMVFDGLPRKDAAKAAGLSDEAARVALTKPHVLAFLNEQQEVLRTSYRPRALRKMGDLLEAKTERIQFEAAKYLDGMDRPQHAVGATQVNVQVNNNVSVTPGYVIRIDRSDDKRPRQIEHLGQHGAKGLGHNADVPEDE